MLDFRELSESGEEFELLVRELLFLTGHHAQWSGRGPDGGRDLLCDELLRSEIQDSVRRWLVQCKHRAHADRSVGIAELDNVVDSCEQHGAAGYLLVCSTVPSAAVVSRLQGISNKEGSRIVATYWDATTIERKLRTPRCWPLAQRFFPRSATEWEVYATEYPNRWIANHRGYYFHLANRIGSKQQLHLKSISDQLRLIEAVSLPEQHFMRLRGVFYDDKHGHYRWFIDHMYPREEDPPGTQGQVKYALKDGYASEHDGQVHEFDILEHEYNSGSDHYDPDHYEFYRPYLSNFAWGIERD